MPNLAELRARIADDLARADLATQIGDAIRDVVRLHEAERFWFNEFYRVTATLSSSSNALALASLPLSVLAIDKVRLQGPGTRWTDLRRIDRDWLATLQDQTMAAPPSAWGIQGDALQFDCAADRNYALLLDGVRKVSTASASADVSAWVNDGRDLLRAGAKRLLYLHVIKDAEQAAACATAEIEALAMLRGKTNLKKAGSRIRPTRF